VQLIAALAFWLSAGLLFFTFAGYPLLIALLSRGKTIAAREFIPQEVRVIIVAHNESGRITARIANLLASDYPAEMLRVTVVSDGSTDGTTTTVKAIGDSRVSVIEQPERSGKAAGLNAGIAAAHEPIIVLTDARQTFEATTIRKLVARLSDPKIGAVSGELQIASAAGGTGSGVDAYWKLERFLRASESVIDSCIGCTGAVYAIRRELFHPLPSDTVLDDVVIPMRIAVGGSRVVHESDAIAFDPQQLEPTAEKRRKRRTLAGNFQMLFRHPSWLLPWKNRLWWQLIAHKYLRLTGPLLLVIIFVSSAALFTNLFYRAALLFQAAFYLLAALGMTQPTRNKILTLPAGFVFLNGAVVAAFWHYLTAPDLARWQTRR
jgi:cellulose synthase/poly-beta-1,6-N-acetylglucosamine synthase-like glycosyltransferase